MFSDNEKQAAFDRIAKLYYERNFGTVTKADFETLLFDIYIEHLLNNGECFDDYTISKALGISQSKVRNLKIKKELKYPHKGFNWKESFVSDIRFAVYDEDNRSVLMKISDVNVMTELRYFLEINGWFDTYQLNPRVFSCRLDSFIKVCEKLSDERLEIDPETEKKLSALKKNDAASSSVAGKFLQGMFAEGCKELAVSASKEVILSVLGVLPFGGLAATAVRTLILVIEKS